MEDMIRPDLGESGFRIKAFIITMMNNNSSVVSTRMLLKSIADTKSRIQPFVQAVQFSEM